MNDRDPSGRWPGWLRAFGLILAGWTVYALLRANMFYWLRQMAGAEDAPFIYLFRAALPEALVWAAFTPAVLAAARRFPITAANWRRRVPLHVAFGALAHVVTIVALYFLHPYIGAGGPPPEMPRSLLSGVFFDAFIYAAIVATWHAVVAQGQALRLRNDLLEAELRMLRMQLQPHFLFNTLNAISELVHRDPDRAERALARLGDLLRWSLQSSSLKEVSLREELAALEIYLDIQRLRHGDALTLHVDADPSALDVAVPSLLLQPLVENAIRHGVLGRGAGSVAVEARRVGDRLVLSVSDDGCGLAPDFREGTGLRATRARLAGLYGDAHALKFTSNGGGGTRVEATIPARPVDAAEPAA